MNKILIIFLSIFLLGNTLIKRKSLIEQNIEQLKHKTTIIDISPPYLQVYHAVNIYSKEYNIPVKYAYRMLREETGWKGPLDINWNPYQISKANALGPTQLLIKTARWISNDYTITKEQVLKDINFNVKTSMKFIRWIYDNQTTSWNHVFGYYNTGYVKTNEYSKRIVI